MKTLEQNLYITYSNQRARDLKTQTSLKPFDKVITLEQLILETFEQNHFQNIINDIIGASIVYQLIQDQGIEYFSYLNADADSLGTIYSFMVKCHRNSVSFADLIDGTKLEAIERIDRAYQVYKKRHYLADSTDIEDIVLSEWDDGMFGKYSDVFVDDFSVSEICFIQSKKQEQVLEKLEKYPKIAKPSTSPHTAKMIHPSNVVFDSIDEVKTALKIVRKLLEEGESAEGILIVASDITEYAPLYKLFLDEYGLAGYSSMGTPLSSFHITVEPKVKNAMDQYRSQL